MAELADALDLGSSSFGSAGSTPVVPTRWHIAVIRGHLVAWLRQTYLAVCRGGGRLPATEEISQTAFSRKEKGPVAQLVEQRTFNP